MKQSTDLVITHVDAASLDKCGSQSIISTSQLGDLYKFFKPSLNGKLLFNVQTTKASPTASRSVNTHIVRRCILTGYDDYP